MRVRLVKTGGLGLRYLVILAAGSFLGAIACYAQSVTGRILGSVHDQQDSAVVGAKVTVTDTLRNITHATVTDDSGDYVVAELEPSIYKIFIEAAQPLKNISAQ